MGILGWIIEVAGLLLTSISLSAIRINEKEIKQLKEKIRTAKPWDSTDFWEKQLTRTEEANTRATVGLFIGGLLVLGPLIAWLAS